MPLMPLAILWIWLRGLFALVLLGGGLWLLYTWYDTLPRPTPVVQTDPERSRPPVPPPSVRARVARWHPGWNRETAAFGGGLLLVLVALGGGRLVYPLRWRAGGHEPGPPQAGTVHHLTRPDGTVLHLESYGPPEAPPLLCTHGWGVTSAQWHILQPLVGPQCRLVVWDLPGLGRSTRPTTADYSLEKMARDLEAIVTFLGPRPVLLEH